MTLAFYIGQKLNLKKTAIQILVGKRVSAAVIVCLTKDVVLDMCVLILEGSYCSDEEEDGRAG